MVTISEGDGDEVDMSPAHPFRRDLAMSALSLDELRDWNLCGHDVYGRPAFKNSEYGPLAVGMDLVCVDKDLYAGLEIEQNVAMEFFKQLENSYQNCPYHNKIHGFEVFAGSHALLSTVQKHLQVGVSSEAIAVQACLIFFL